MAVFICKYADLQGRVHQQVESAASEQELRERFSQQGMMIYSVKPHRALTDLRLVNAASRSRKINLEQFLIFNQQFVTLMRSGLPILRSLDLLVVNIKNRKLAGHMEAIRSQVTSGMSLSQAFQSQGVFPPMYITSLMAGEKSGSLSDVIDRYVQYQKIALEVRKKILVSLIYPALLVTLVLALVVFLITYVVPEFASLYASMDSELPYVTQLLVAVGLAVSDHLNVVSFALLAIGGALLWWMRSGWVVNSLDRFKIKIPVFGQIWIKYQISQLCRLLSTLLHGGIPLMQALETTGQSLGSPLLRDTILRAKQLVKEGQSLSKSLAMAGIFPSLAIEMIQVGESTGALPAMLNSVASFFDDDVNTLMTAVLSLIEPVIMIFMGIFVAFVLISLYLPIFSLAERI